MIVNRMSELPSVYLCRLCGVEKPIAQMVVVRLRSKVLLRPRCKDCHNVRERGHRREWKTKYLQRWRRANAELNESYWRQANAANRREVNARAYFRFLYNHNAILIQGRLRRQLGQHITLDEARQLAKKFGPCYPSRFGLTALGLRECERIRSAMRRLGKHLCPVEIRVMVYADGHFIKPSRQQIPYKSASEKLRRWHERRKQPA